LQNEEEENAITARRPRNPQSAIRNPQSVVLRMKLAGANPNVEVKGEEE
jgi:hypothetical protein